MNELLFRFTLNNAIEGSHVIKEPDGWKDATLKLERDPEYHSLVELYDQVFISYGGTSEKYDGGYEYILNVLETQGPDSDISILTELSEDGGVTWETLNNGLIDLSSIREIDFLTIQYGVVRDSFWTRFWNQRSTAIDIQSANDIYGDARPVIAPIALTLTGQVVKMSYEGHGDISNTITYVIPDGQYGQLDMAIDTIDEIEDKFSMPRLVNIAKPGGLFLFRYGGDIVVNMEFYFYQGSFIGSSSVDPNVKIQLQINDTAPVDLTQTNQTSGIDSWTKYSYSGTLTGINAKDALKIYIINSSGSSQTIYWFANVIHDSFITLSQDSVYQDTVIDSVKLHEAGQSILDRIIGQDDSLYSEYLGNTDTARVTYSETGCFSYSSIEKGLHIKGFTLAEKPFSLSFADFWKGINPIFNLGLGYEEIGGNQVIRIEPKEYFYDPTVILNLDYVNNIEHSIRTENIFKNIKIGYEKWESESLSGLDEVQTKHEYSVPLRKIGEDIELYSKFIAAAIATENTRRKSVEKEKDWRLDENIFITQIFKDGSDYLPYTAENLGGFFPDANNVNNPQSRYNLLLTPARNFLRWRVFFNGGVQFNTDYLFQNGEGNIDAQTIDASLFPSIECAFGSLFENADIPITIYKLFGIDVYQFEHPLTWAQYKLLRDNRTKALGVSTGNTGHESFFILSLAWSPVVPKGVFKLIRAGFSSPIPTTTTAPTTTTTTAATTTLAAELIEDISITPTWKVYYADYGVAFTLIGSDFNSNTSFAPFTSNITRVWRDSPSGIAEGNGTVKFYKNGILMNTYSFIAGDDLSGGTGGAAIEYTFTGISIGDLLLASIEESEP